MRLTYLDEAGISAREPYAVVSGVIVDGDRQLRKVEEALAELLAKYIPKEDRRGFVFHATHIWSGVKYFKDREVWPLSKRLEILAELAALPASFDLPITSAVCGKADIVEMTGQRSPKLLDIVSHVLAYATALQMVERFFMYRFPTEYTLIIAEDHPQVKKMLREVHSMLQSPEKLPSFLLNYDELPFLHIRDTVMFADKKDSPTLQLADVCSFIIRGVASGHPRSGPLFEALRPALLDPNCVSSTLPKPSSRRP